MKTVVVTIATSPTPFPAGTVASGIVVSLSGGAIGPQTITAAPYTATFEGVAPGTYTASAQSVDAAGQPLGGVMTSSSFVIAEDDINIDIPSSITVSVA